MATNKQPMTKKLVNDVAACVDENLRGLVATHPAMRLHPQHRVVTLNTKTGSGNVAVIGGGGSGHEPFAAGFVGTGALSGAVAGGIFASPPTSHVLYAITYLHKYHSGGVFVIIGNYTGDRLNFGKAIEKAKIAGLKVDSIILGEDVASSNNKTGGRGMCGEVFLYKMCGAMSANGESLSDIQNMANKIASRLATLGVCLNACSLPGQPPLFHIADDELELGAGVHGEAGITKQRLGTAKETVELVLQRIIQHMSLDAGSRVAVMINNLGGTTYLEMNILCGETKKYLDSKKIKTERMYAGHLKTSLEMHGFQICLLDLNPEFRGKWLELLDAGTDAPGWPGGPLSLATVDGNIQDDDDIMKKYAVKKETVGPSISDKHQDIFRTCLEEAAKILVENEELLNRLDSGCGDGDCGNTLKNLAQAIRKYVKNSSLKHPSGVLWELSEIAEGDMGGTSGGIYSLGLSAASQTLASEKTVDASSWARSWESGLRAISRYGGAEPGDRTMLDTLSPALEAFKLNLQSDLKTTLISTIAAAEEGALATTNMVANAGRASYVASGHTSNEDAGARAAALWLRAVLLNISNKVYS